MPLDRARVRDFARSYTEAWCSDDPRPSPPIPVLVSKNRAAREPTPIFSRLFARATRRSTTGSEPIELISCPYGKAYEDPRRSHSGARATSTL
jgi:hypothetical protein